MGLGDLLATREVALGPAKRHLRLSSDEHDELILASLNERPELRDGEYQWPDWMRSALIRWRSREPRAQRSNP